MVQDSKKLSVRTVRKLIFIKESHTGHTIERGSVVTVVDTVGRATNREQELRASVLQTPARQIKRI